MVHWRASSPRENEESPGGNGFLRMIPKCDFGAQSVPKTCFGIFFDVTVIWLVQVFLPWKVGLIFMHALL